MKKISFKAPFGNQLKNVELTKMNDGTYHIMSDKWYQGQMILRDGKWFGYLADKSELKQDDINALAKAFWEKLKTL